jgi:hypothetical protein
MTAHDPAIVGEGLQLRIMDHNIKGIAEIAPWTYVQSRVTTVARLIRVGEFATLSRHISTTPVSNGS